MLDALALIMLLSALAAAWSYWHARRLHHEIETESPGFNDAMRKRNK